MPLSERAKNILNFLNGFRKFTVMSAIFVIAVIFRVIGLLTGAEFVSLLVPTGVAFFGMNGLEHMTDAVKEWLKVKFGDKNEGE